MAMMEISIVPIGTGTPSVSKYIARAVRLLQGESDIKYQLNAMGTIIEGELEQLLSLAAKMHQSVFAEGIKRAVTTIRIDERCDKPSTIKSKVASVTRKLGR